MTYYEIVKKLIGPIDPVGETNEDDKRFKNLEALCELVDELVSDIAYVEDINSESHRCSENRAGLFASKFLDRLGIKQ